MFQLTRPRGTRLKNYKEVRQCKSFNSRVRGGRDFYVPSRPHSTDVSTHASAGDATVLLRQVQRTPVFQLTRPRGTRLLSFEPVSGVILFQLTRPRGTRPIVSWCNY